MKKIVYLSKAFSFESAHFLPNHKGKCQNLHGHSYELIVTISGSINKDTGMVIDFSDLKHIVKENIIKKYDHKMLNDIYKNPTAEIMAIDIFEILQKLLPSDISLYKIKLYETKDSFVEYYGECNEN